MTPRQPRTSRDLCMTALQVYQALFLRLPYQDPDAGFGESFCSGMRWLEALEQAVAWDVPESTLLAVERLFEVTRALADDDVADRVVIYPHQFLLLIDRRHAALMRSREGRRAMDRRPARAMVLTPN